MSFLGAAIGGIGGGLLDLWGRDRDQDRIDQRNRTQIQTRVADAEKAGVHPLFALGANLQSGPSTVASGNTLGNMARSVGNAFDRRAERKHAASQNQSNVEANRALARETNARTEGQSIQNEIARLELFRLRQQVMGGRHLDNLDVLPDGSKAGVQLTPHGVIDLEPARQRTENPNEPGVTAGLAPLWRKYKLGRIFGKDIPLYLIDAENASESMESVAAGLAAIGKNAWELDKWWFKKLFNAAAYGPKALNRAIQEMERGRSVETPTWSGW